MSAGGFGREAQGLGGSRPAESLCSEWTRVSCRLLACFAFEVDRMRSPYGQAECDRVACIGLAPVAMSPSVQG